jgi:hypothetical protein
VHLRHSTSDRTSFSSSARWRPGPTPAYGAGIVTALSQKYLAFSPVGERDVTAAIRYGRAGCRADENIPSSGK